MSPAGPAVTAPTGHETGSAELVQARPSADAITAGPVGESPTDTKPGRNATISLAFQPAGPPGNASSDAVSQVTPSRVNASGWLSSVRARRSFPAPARRVGYS